MNREKRLKKAKERLDIYRELTRTWGIKVTELEKALDVMIKTNAGNTPIMLLSTELANYRKTYREFFVKREALTTQVTRLKQEENSYYPDELKDTDRLNKLNEDDHIESLKNAIHPNELEDEIKGE
ncbi:hypothetical protein ACSHUI_00255 [Bacillus subtilis]|uniref:hypothetical protein n=1 Tax=Bacillus subtilis TaxID=1423 RepID=UPI003CEDC6E7